MVVWRKRQENFKEGNAIKHISRKTLKKSCGFCFSIKLLFSQGVLIFGETLFTCFTWNDTMSSLSKNHGVFKSNVFSHCFPRKRKSSYDFVVTAWFPLWTSLGLNQGPPDYESVALTNWATSPMNQRWFVCAKLQSFFEISKCIADFLEYETLLLLQARLIHTEKMKPQNPKR